MKRNVILVIFFILGIAVGFCCGLFLFITWPIVFIIGFFLGKNILESFKLSSYFWPIIFSLTAGIFLGGIPFWALAFEEIFYFSLREKACCLAGASGIFLFGAAFIWFFLNSKT